MKARNAIILLLFLNLLSLAALIGLWQTQRSAKADPPPVIPVQRAAPMEKLPAHRGTNFNWQQVESADYRAYIANLRAIGCPEETIRDIVIADVTKLFAARKKALLHSEPWKYWQPNQPDGAQLTRQRQEGLQKLEQERHLLLAALLGPQVEEELARSEEGDALDRLQFLSPTQRAEILRLESRFKEARQAVYNEAEEYGSAPDWKRLKALHDQRESELAQTLSPGDLFEYQLRNDEVSERLRRSLTGFEPTEAEFRELFRLRKEQEKKFNLVDPSDTAALAEENADGLNTENQIKSYLGETRYLELRRSSDSRFRDFYRLTQQFDLSATTAATIYDRHLQMQNEITHMQRDPALTAEQKDKILRGYQEEIDALLHQTLGEEAYARYQAAGSAGAFLGN